MVSFRNRLVNLPSKINAEVAEASTEDAFAISFERSHGEDWELYVIERDDEDGELLYRPIHQASLDARIRATHLFEPLLKQMVAIQADRLARLKVCHQRINHLATMLPASDEEGV